MRVTPTGARAKGACPLGRDEDVAAMLTPGALPSTLRAALSLSSLCAVRGRGHCFQNTERDFQSP